MTDESMSYLEALKEIKRLKETLNKIRAEIEKESGKFVVVPDNATNGEVIKAVFPNIIVEYGYGLAIGVDFGVGGERDLSRDWWNAPYKRGDTE